MEKVMTTGEPAVSLRAGSCRTPQRMAMYQPRRQSSRATEALSTMNPRNRIVTIGGVPLLTRRAREHSGAAAAGVEPPRQEEAAHLADQLRRNRPGMGGVKTGDDVRAQPPQRITPQRPAVVHGKVIVADRVHRRGRPAVVAVRAQAAGGELEVVDGGARLE